MTYEEIKNQIISLGFAEESDYEEYEELGYTYVAINRAISEIGIMFPRLAKYEFEILDTDEGFKYIDMSATDSLWLDFADTPVLIETKYSENGQTRTVPHYERFADYEIELGNTIVINQDENKGKFRIFYKKQCTPISTNTDDSFVPELPLKVHSAIPLLASYYLWLDDDINKANKYYENYMATLNTIQSVTNRPKLKIAKGGV